MSGFETAEALQMDSETKDYTVVYRTLYPREEILSSKLFGDGKENGNFRYAIGDFIAIAESANKALVSLGDQPLFSQHAGYTDDEIYVPLIVISN